MYHVRDAQINNDDDVCNQYWVTGGWGNNVVLAGYFQCMMAKDISILIIVWRGNTILLQSSSILTIINAVFGRGRYDIVRLAQIVLALNLHST